MCKTFILSIGAQRTGSTWLHSQITKNKQLQMGLCKEHHIFDVLFSPYFAKYERELREYVVDARTDAPLYQRKKTLLSFIDDPQKYFNYFDHLYRKSRVIKAVGDMTPSYSMLDAEAFEFIRDGLEEKGFKVKVVFIMRDPVERIWSMQHKAADIKAKIAANNLNVVGLKAFEHPGASMRTRYDRTITELEKVFPEKDIFYGCYEDFFNTATYMKLGEFLNIELKQPDFRFVRNQSLLKNDIDPILAAEAANLYADTYSFISSRFGVKIEQLWQGFRFLKNP